MQENLQSWSIAPAPDMTPLDRADPQEWYFSQGYTDLLPDAPPTPDKVAPMVEVLRTDCFSAERRIVMGGAK
jgi:hypothetical protein